MTTAIAMMAFMRIIRRSVNNALINVLPVLHLIIA